MSDGCGCNRFRNDGRIGRNVDAPFLGFSR
jgi:hypothetical protein